MAKNSNSLNALLLSYSFFGSPFITKCLVSLYSSTPSKNYNLTSCQEAAACLPTVLYFSGSWAVSLQRSQKDSLVERERTSRQEASYGQRYPCPALYSFWVEVGLQRGSGPDRGRSPIKWGDFPSIHPSVCPSVRHNKLAGTPGTPRR